MNQQKCSFFSFHPWQSKQVSILAKVQLVHSPGWPRNGVPAVGIESGPTWSRGTLAESASCGPGELNVCGSLVNTKHSTSSCSNRTRIGEPGPPHCSWSICLCSSHLKQKEGLSLYVFQQIIRPVFKSWLRTHDNRPWVKFCTRMGEFPTFKAPQCCLNFNVWGSVPYFVSISRIQRWHSTHPFLMPRVPQLSITVIIMIPVPRRMPESFGEVSNIPDNITDLL